MEHYFTNNNNLKSEFRTVVFKYGDELTQFTSDLGVFSKDKIDYGSNLLINTYFKNGRKAVKVLDVGCGYGIIGILLAKYMQTKSTLVDVNKRAVHLTNINIKNTGVDAKTFESDIYSSVRETYDVIITNPPIRAGKQTVLNILLGASDYLNNNGELWFVIRKDQGAKSIMEKMKSTYNLETVEKSKGFFIILAKKHWH